MKKLVNIQTIAKKAHIQNKYLIPYGKYMAKIDLSINEELKGKKDGKLVLVTALTPTSLGEGKTTTSIALNLGLNKIGQDSLLCLREPSLGPVFGIKGGATGGGKSTIEPSETINLHFTGDMHALTSSINLISAVVENHIYQGNELGIDPHRIVWKRALDMNDRSLRRIIVSRGEKRIEEHESSFLITVASELMAILCLSSDFDDFIKRVNEITVAYTYDDKPIKVKDLKISHAIGKLMKDAIKPNLVQTSEHTPCIVHGGPFANIAHGANSIIATKLALKLAPIVVTEAGFGADLGAEKFFDITARSANLHVDLTVLVATIRALKLHGGMSEADCQKTNVEALKIGLANLERHAENMKLFKVPFIIAINHFASDSEEEINCLIKWCKEKGYKYSFLDGFEKGGCGSIELAKKVVEILNNEKSEYSPIYDLKWSLEKKIETIAKKIYHADGVIYSDVAKEKISKYEKAGYNDYFVCMAKTPLSFSDDPKLKNAPTHFNVHIRDINFASGAKFVIPLLGNIMTMPGLPKIPAAVKMEDLDI